jgi:hypothetical protein
MNSCKSGVICALLFAADALRLRLWFEWAKDAAAPAKRLNRFIKQAKGPRLLYTAGHRHFAG